MRSLRNDYKSLQEKARSDIYNVTFLYLGSLGGVHYNFGGQRNENVSPWPSNLAVQLQLIQGVVSWKHNLCQIGTFKSVSVPLNFNGMCPNSLTF